MDEPKRLVDVEPRTLVEVQMLRGVRQHQMSKSSRDLLLRRARRIAWRGYLSSPWSAGFPGATRGRILLAALFISASATAGVTQLTRSPKVRGEKPELPDAHAKNSSAVSPAFVPALKARVPSISVRSEPSSSSPPSEARPPIVEPMPTQSATRVRKERGPRASSPGTLEEEIVLVDRMRSALQGGSAASALALSQDYFRRFPRGQFLLEAQAMQIEALFSVGEKKRARDLARGFLAQAPRSRLARRVRPFAQSE